MRATRKLVRDLTEDEVRQCEKLTYGWGDMKPQLRTCVREGSGEVHLMKHGGRVVGWSLVFEDYRDRYVYFYVSGPFRRKGVGSRLMKSVLKYARRYHRRIPTVCVWNPRSQGFFNNFPNPQEDRS